MARAKRDYIPGQIWHITHRCHKREFLLKFAKDRRRWLLRLFEARKRYVLIILNHTVMSNHIHLLVADDADRKTIPDSIKLAAGRTGQAINIRYAVYFFQLLSDGGQRSNNLQSRQSINLGFCFTGKRFSEGFNRSKWSHHPANHAAANVLHASILILESHGYDTGFFFV